MPADSTLVRALVSNNSWNEKKIDLDGLSMPKQKEITIRIPTGFEYTRGESKRPLIASFKINENTFDGTPTTLINSIFRTRRGACLGDELTKYISKNELWMISKRLIILDNQIAYISLPTMSSDIIVGPRLLISCSPMAKVLREKVIPQMVTSYGKKMTIQNTSGWIMNSHIFNTIDNTYDIILNHIDEICQ